MKKIIVFRPNVISLGTAFECQALIYKFLQEYYDYHFIIIKDFKDNYFDPALTVFSIPAYVWKTIPLIPFFYYPFAAKWKLHPIFKQADGFLTVDPTIYPQGLLSIYYAARSGKPVWFDSSLTHTGEGRFLFWKLVWRPIMRKALKKTSGAIITVPKCLERFNDLGLLCDDNSQKFSVMGHPVDTSIFKPHRKKSETDGIIRVIVVARLVPEKGHYYIIEAMTPLLRSHSKLQLQILGAGPMKLLLEKEIENRNLNEQVVFLEPVSHHKLPEVLASSDIFINHAVSTAKWEEYFGVANLEAMACGLPCVITKSGGIPYVIRDEGVALLVEERNVIELREMIAKLVASEPTRLQISSKAREYVENNYSLPLIAERFHKMLVSGFKRT